MADKDDEYREQTLEDLEDIPPMGKTQKIVLIVAAVFLLGFAAYYFVFSHLG